MSEKKRSRIERRVQWQIDGLHHSIIFTNISINVVSLIKFRTNSITSIKTVWNVLKESCDIAASYLRLSPESGVEQWLSNT